MLNQPSPASPLRRAFLKIEELEARLQADAAARSQPLALVGVGCRLPGEADSPQALWELLAAGRDATGEIPADRWNISEYFDPQPGVPGKMYTTRGGFLRNVDGFDAAFFGISPREAAQLDPQQRLLLEVSWEALENAGIAPARLRGSRSGVYVGLATYDYAHLQIKSGDPTHCDAYFGTGTASSVASGRLAYTLGLQGPAISIDTACSSSLVALHLACRALRHGDCDLALVAGVNLILSPETVISMCQSRMMAADGRCKTFDSAADGFGQAEGCVVVVVKRLSDAVRDGDRVLALVRGTAVNQDGASSGLTAPNGPAQEAVIREALADAGLSPQDVGYVEAHGTGTTLGDPIEVQALASVYGAQRTADRPLWIGSIKTNLGHLEAAAGLAGLLKVVLALEQRQIPPHLHFNNPNPLIPWSALPVRVANRLTAFEQRRGKRIAGLSSFGFSGTNAHILLEEAPPLPPQTEIPQTAERPLHLFTLAARSAGALSELAGRYRSYLAAHPQERLADIAYSANIGRSPAEHRLAVSARETNEVAAALEALLADKDNAALRRGALDSLEVPRAAFLFTGQGSQYPDMARQLFDESPIFRAAFDECDALFSQHLPGSLRDVIYDRRDDRAAGQREIDQTLWTQPALFAVEWSLLSLWRSWGIEPALVIGHSIGEYVAACASGVCSLADGVRLVAARAQLMSRLPGGGAMTAVLADEAQVLEIVHAIPGVGIAAVNGPRSTVVSGIESGVAEVERRLKLAGVASIRLSVSHAFHSALLEPMLDDFQAAADAVTWHDPAITLISNLTGQAVRKGEMTCGQYWRRHARSTVRFAEGLRSAYALGYRTFVEIGPKPILSTFAAQCLADDCVCLPSLSEGKDAWQRMIDTLGQLYLHGVPVDWLGFDRPYPRRKLTLPTYPFQRQRYWIDTPSGSSHKAQYGDAKHYASAHPHLERRFDTALGDVLFEGRLDPARHTYLADHVVHGEIVLPTAFYLEVAAAAVREVNPTVLVALKNVIIHEAVRVPAAGKDLQLIINSGSTAAGQFQIFCRDDGADWRLAVSGQFSIETAESPGTAELSGAPQPAGSQSVDIDDFYAWCDRIGLNFGPSFRGLQAVERSDNAAVGQIELPPGAGSSNNFGLHPAAFDACLQTLAAALPGFDSAQSETEVYMPIGIDRFQLSGPTHGRLVSRVRLEPSLTAKPETLTGHVTIENESGVAIASITGLHMKRAPKASLVRPAATDLGECFYEARWEEIGDGTPQPSTLAAVAWPQEIENLESRAAELHSRYELRSATEIEPHLDRACSAYVVRALGKLGWTLRVGQRVTLTQLIQDLGVAGRQQLLFGRLLELLVEDGVLQPVSNEQTNGSTGVGRNGHTSAADSPLLHPNTPDTWRVVSEPEAVDADGLIDHLVLRFPALRPEILFAQRGGSQLAEALRGQIDPADILFPDGSFELADELYRSSPAALAFNDLAQSAVVRAIEQLPAGSRLRVLEVGGGTGGLTSAVLPVLPADRTQYVFTDLSAGFFAKASADFAAFPFVEYRTLDIEVPPVRQGWAEEQFDLIVASNVLHATADIGLAIEHVRSLLKPGGQLLVLEGVRPKRWIDLSFGLTQGWWKFTDVALREGYPLISGRHWRELLRAKGFDGTAIVPDDRTESPPSDHALILSSLPTAKVGTAGAISSTDEYLLFADSQGLADALQSRLSAAGARCVMVCPGERFEEVATDRFRIDVTRQEDSEQLLERAYIDQGRNCQRIVYMWPLDHRLADTAPRVDLMAHLESCCRPLLGLIRGLAAQSMPQSPKLWLVTEGAQAVVDGESLNGLPQSAIWGFGKVLAQEHPELDCVRLDLETGGGVEPLLRELAAGSKEPMVAYRAGLRRAARLARIEIGASQDSPAASTAQPVQLEIVERGTSAGVALRPARRRQPAAGQVEIEVRATGLNFRDVLNVLGVRNDEAPLGGEVSGVVTAVGSGVSGICVGDEVVAVTSGGLGTYALAQATLVLPKPATLDFSDAAASPLAFLTAHYALSVVGQMKASERVLIHAGAGGVGMAAVRLAQDAGLEVMATAGSPTKRDFLRTIGVKHVFDSRSLAFADELQLATGGEGVDLVLNSLTGASIAASLGLLRAGGRFLEIGKSEIWSRSQVESVNPNAQYHAVDLAAQIAEHPDAVRPLFIELLERLASGQLKSLPVKKFPLTSASDAIEHMARARHIGKVVLLPAASARGASNRANASPQLLADATYLISGALTGLGLAAARRLVERGARHLLLFGRRAPSADAQDALAAMRELGAQVVVAQADVSCEADMRQLFEGPLRSLPPLRGVIHSAGRLEDGVLTQQDWTRFSQVLAPKVEGAWLLHQLTAECSLDFFVLFSSASALLGAPGQANHAAANAFLDSLAHYRRARQLPAVSINWGAWAQIGAAAERSVGQRIGKQGIGELSVEEGLAAFERSLRGDRPQVGVIRADWSQLVTVIDNPGEKRFFSHLATTRAVTPTRTSETATSVAARQLSEASPEKRRGLLLAHVRAQVASVIGLAPDQSAPDKQPLRDMGLDSLMAVELRNRLRIGLAIERVLPATLVFDHPTVAALTEYLATEVYGWESAARTARAAVAELGTLDAIEQLSDEDVEKLLSQRLGRVS